MLVSNVRILLVRVWWSVGKARVTSLRAEEFAWLGLTG
jgi:hypothetical protein